MKLVLLTADDCDICEEAEEKFKKEFWQEIDKGGAKVVNLDEDEEFQEIFLEHDLPLAPIVLFVTDKNQVVAHIEADDFFQGLKKASPTTAEVAKQP